MNEADPPKTSDEIPGTRIREMRVSARLTLEQLAERVEMSVSYVSRLESGRRNLSYKNLVKFSAALGVSPRQLMPRTDAVPLVGTLTSDLVVDLRLSSICGATHFQENSSLTTVAIHVLSEVGGWLVSDCVLYFDFDLSPSVSDFLGQRCVLRLATGEILIRRIEKRTSEYNFHLSAPGCESLFDVEIAGATGIDAIVPMGAATTGLGSMRMPERIRQIGKSILT